MPQLTLTLTFLSCLTLFGAVCQAADALPVVDECRFVQRKPAAGWQQADFDDSAWRKGKGGFGTFNTPGARVNTKWTTKNIWIRKSFELDSIPEHPALMILHDESAEVFLNGELVGTFSKYITKYDIVPLDEAKLAAVKKGTNVLAIHCNQSTGGQFIDVHFIDADNPPELPAAKKPTSPFKTELITTWGEEVTPENAWTEYPRPQLQRNNWQNLNGEWDYKITPDTRKATPAEWKGKILVPFCLESQLGGVQRLLAPNEALWYHRTFDVASVDSGKTLLNFEAVDYECEVFVNGKSVGTHKGGNTPFAFDITDAVKAGANELVVRVQDDTQAWQLRGKQVLEPGGIFYTRVSGIWQTVWLEQVPEAYIEKVKIATDAAAGTITVRPIIANGTAANSFSVVVKDGDQQVAKQTGKGEALTVTVKDAKLWSPASPHLYDLEITLLDGKNKTVDQVDSYAGIRSVGKMRDQEGNLRFTLNGKPIFHFGPLDQGWWPDGLLTPPSDEAMVFEIEWLKSAGFNMIRKHIKVEPRRYYYHCDRLGMLMWQDHVSGGQGANWTHLEPGPMDAKWPEEEHEQSMLELERMIDLLESHPCIVVWVPFNEAWGQHLTMKVGEWVVARDPSRLVNIASGGNFWPVGDVVDQHHYPHPGFPFAQDIAGRFDAFIKVVGEFGGHGFPVKDHVWNPEFNNWGYGGLPKDETEYKERYTTSIEKLNELRAKGIAGGVYTQTTDVEGEINGLMTYDRKVIKIPAEELAELHSKLYTEPAKESSN